MYTRLVKFVLLFMKESDRECTHWETIRLLLRQLMALLSNRYFRNCARSVHRVNGRKGELFTPLKATEECQWARGYLSRLQKLLTKINFALMVSARECIIIKTNIEKLLFPGEAAFFLSMNAGKKINYVQNTCVLSSRLIRQETYSIL